MSTFRFALVWGVSEAVGRAAVLFVIQFALRDSMYPGRWVMVLLYGGGIGLIGAAMGAWILRNLRRPVKGWFPASWAGAVASSVVVMGAMQGVIDALGPGWTSMSDWLRPALMAVSSATRGLVLGSAEGFALWRRSWPPAWRLWLAGRVGVAVLASAASYALGWLDPGWTKYAQGASYGFVEAAGRAGLLDRCVFKPEAAEGRAA